MAFYGHISLDLMPYLSVAETQLLDRLAGSSIGGVKMISDTDAFRKSGSTESRKPRKLLLSWQRQITAKQS